MLTHVPHGQGGFERNLLEPDPDLNALRLGYEYPKLKRGYCTSDRPLLTLQDLIKQWEKITGQSPDKFIKQLKSLSKARLRMTSARVTYTDIKSYDLSHIARMRRTGKIPNIFLFATPAERREIAKFLASEGIYSDVLDTFFDPNVIADPQLDQNVHQEPQPEPINTRENILHHPNKKPRLDLDLNKEPVLGDASDVGGDEKEC